MVIEPVPVGELVTWWHRKVVCAKKNGKPRRTVDLQVLNKYAARETHHTPSSFHQTRSVSAKRKKAVFDDWNGYHSVSIRKEDHPYTTFITPWGRYRSCAALQGYTAYGDEYSRRYNEIVSVNLNITKGIDDTIMLWESVEESFHQAAYWLNTCEWNGIVLNPEKFEFAHYSVELFGFEVSRSDLKPTSKYSGAIQNFPTPKEHADVRSWSGIVKQVPYISSIAEKISYSRNLLKTDVHEIKI